MAFEQDLLLVGDVVVQRRLGDTQGLGDIVQRGIVIATGAESTRSLAQQGRAFQRKQLIPARCHILPGRRFATALCHTHSPLNLTRNADRPEPAVMPEPGNRACGWKLSTILPQSQKSCPE